MAKCQSCLGADVKKSIVSADRNLYPLVMTIPDCKDPLGIELCGTRAGGKRVQSAYNQFVSSCMREPGNDKGPAPERMRKCAQRWRERKANTGEHK